MRILIVDDNEDLTLVLQEVLEEEGFDIASANDGQEGFLASLRFRPDLVITDIQMPGGNGLKLMEQIRRHNPTVRAIYMSANLGSFRSPLEEEKRKYPVSLLQKPFSRMKLLVTVSALSS